MYKNGTRLVFKGCSEDYTFDNRTVGFQFDCTTEFNITLDCLNDIFSIQIRSCPEDFCNTALKSSTISLPLLATSALVTLFSLFNLLK